jgi:uncharacterized protein YjbI with pentapeptide repeats
MGYDSKPPAACEEVLRRHGQVSETIRRTMLVLLGFSLFCWLTAGSPDLPLIVGEPTIEVPFADVPVSFPAFLIVAPLGLVVLLVYLHIFEAERLRLEVQLGNMVGDRLPTLFNLSHPAARFLTAFIFYWVVPLTLGAVTWKAWTRPVEWGLPMLAVTAIVTVALSYVQGSRASGRVRHLALALLYIGLYIGLAVVAVAVVTRIPQEADVPERRARVVESWHQEVVRQLARGMLARPVDLTGVDLSGTWLYRARLQNAVLSQARLTEAILTEADLRNAWLVRADLRDADLQGANLSEAWLSRSDLRGADLRGADLQGANGGEPNLFGADLRGADLRGISLLVPDLREADLREANLEKGYLGGADLRKADLRGAILEKAELREADLRAAKLEGANLRAAVLREADVPPDYRISTSGPVPAADLRDAAFCRTIMPDGNTCNRDCPDERGEDRGCAWLGAPAKTSD